MGIKVLITAATSRELSALSKIGYDGAETDFLLTGVGTVSTTWNLMNYFTGHSMPDLVVNTGIAGSFSPAYPVGSVVIAGSDCFGDLGIEKDGNFISLFDAGFEKPDDPPYKDGMLYASSKLVTAAGNRWPVVKGVTVNTTSGSRESIERITMKFKPDIETMEGGAVYYTCNRLGVPAIGIRGISNMILPGDRSGWDIDLALSAIGPAVSKLIENILQG